MMGFRFPDDFEALEARVKSIETDIDAVRQVLRAVTKPLPPDRIIKHAPGTHLGGVYKDYWAIQVVYPKADLRIKWVSKNLNNGAESELIVPEGNEEYSAWYVFREEYLADRYAARAEDFRLNLTKIIVELP